MRGWKWASSYLMQQSAASTASGLGETAAGRQNLPWEQPCVLNAWNDFVALTGDSAGAARAREQRRKFRYNWAREKSFTKEKLWWSGQGCRFPGGEPSYPCDTLLSCRAGGAWHQASLGNAGVSGVPGRRERGFNFAVTLPFGSCSLPLRRWRRPHEERRDHCLLGLLWLKKHRQIA